MAISAVIFDFGNVLDTLDDPQPWHNKRDELASPFGLTGEQLWNRIYYTEPWQKAKRGQISVIDFWDAILAPLGITDQAEQSAFVKRMMEGHDQVHPEMAALLRELKPHYKIGLLSNTDVMEMDTWIADVHGLKDIFNTVVSSAKVGMAKPEPAIYQLTLDRLGIAPEEALFVDDLPRNTIAAEALGIQSIIFKSPTQLRHELRMRGVFPIVPNP